MDAGLIIVALVALAVGGLIGWLLGSRGGEQGKATAESLRMQLDGVVAERDSARAEIGPLNSELARLRAEAEHFDQRMKDLAANRDALVTQFREIGDQLLEKAHKDFLAKAGERFTEADKATQAKLQNLLQPVAPVESAIALDRIPAFRAVLDKGHPRRSGRSRYDPKELSGGCAPDGSA